MCGIFGFYDRTGAKHGPEVTAKMTAALSHRGPDSSGSRNFRIEGGEVLLGATRLRIQDLSSAADQPVQNENSSVWVVFNGEIYNFRDLRSGLKEKGHIFRSSSDTEVIVHLYEEYGASFVSKLDGMFALALLDLKTEALFLARDRTGKKPLFYSRDSGKLTFASEIKALLCVPGIKKSFNEGALAEYLHCGYISAPDTAYSGINELQAGELLVISRSGIAEPQAFWELKDVTIDIGEEEAGKKIRQLIGRAVEKRLVSDVPVGVLLSGGLDSSIVALTASAGNKKVKTFCAAFLGEDSFDERKYAALVAKEFKTEHIELMIKSSPVETVLELPGIFDQPFGDSSAIPSLLISREARKHVTVVLTGDGGDEGFAGYDRFRAALLAESLPLYQQRILRQLAFLLPRSTSIHALKSRLERFTSGLGESVMSRHNRWFSVFAVEELSGLLKDEGQGFVSLATEKQDALIEKTKGNETLDRLLNLNFNSYLKYNLNTKMDRCSMAASLEARSPLLDTELLEFAFSLPSKLKIKAGQSKYILKKAYGGLLPKAILGRKKQGFGSPVAKWFKGELGALYSDCVLGKDSRCASRFKKECLEDLNRAHLSGKRDNGRKLWALLQLELWLRKEQA